MKKLLVSASLSLLRSIDSLDLSSFAMLNWTCSLRPSVSFFKTFAGVSFVQNSKFTSPSQHKQFNKPTAMLPCPESHAVQGQESVPGGW